MKATDCGFSSHLGAMSGCVLWCLFLLVFSFHAFAQTDTEASPARAEELMNRGEFGPARQLLERYIQREPKDATALRLLGRLCYWLHDVEHSRVYFDRALVIEPANTSLRLEYGRMLAETGSWSMTRTVLQPLLMSAEHAGEAEYLIGLLDYWSGDWTAAVERFEAVLRRNPQHADARRHFRDIRMTTASSVALTSEYQSDTQPLDRVVLSARALINRTPLQGFTLQADHQRVEIETTTPRISSVVLGFSQYHASWRMDTEAAVGFLRRSFTSTSMGLWRVALGFRPTASLKLTLRGERSGYHWTAASVQIPVQTTSFGAFADWNSPNGWMGQAAFEVVSYPDKNIMQRSYLWLLAPIVYGGETRVSMGYGFSWSDAKENRFTLRNLLDLYSGIYTPYYTPEQQRLHNILASFSTMLSSDVKIKTNLSYAVYAVEQAPFFSYPTRPSTGITQPQKAYSQRTFHPWKASVAVLGALSTAFTWTLEGTYWSTAYYDSRHLVFNVSYRLIPSE
jgi:tetratricopeptide (TPR) repeat protein